MAPTVMKIRFPLLPAPVRWGAVVSVAAFVFYVSIVTVAPETAVGEARPAPQLIPLDKWRHFLAYATLGTTVAYALEERETNRRALVLWVLLSTVAYGVSIEVWQSFLPSRYFSPADAYANVIGATLSLAWFAVRPHLQMVPVGSTSNESAGNT